MKENENENKLDSCPYWIDHMCFKNYLQKLREDVVNECLEVVHKNDKTAYWNLKDQFEEVKKVKDYSFAFEEPDNKKLYQNNDGFDDDNQNKEGEICDDENNDYELVYQSNEKTGNDYFNDLDFTEPPEFNTYSYSSVLKPYADQLLHNMESYFDEPDVSEEVDIDEAEDYDTGENESDLEDDGSEDNQQIVFQFQIVQILPEKTCETVLGKSVVNLYTNGVIFQRKKISFTYQEDKDILYLWTKIGFWKVIEKDGLFCLYHKNHFASDAPFDEMCMGKYHRQADLGETKSLEKVVRYIVDHDHAKEIIMDDYRNLPTTTKKQKKYFKQTKKKIQHKNIRRTEYLFKQIEDGNLDQFKMSL